MATNKKSFIAYSDWLELFEELEDDEAGRLIKHVLRYVNDLEPEAPDKLTKMAFIPIKQTLKRDLQKYEGIRERNVENGKKGGRPKKPTGLSGLSEKPKKADSVSDSVNVSDNVSDNVNEINKSKEDVPTKVETPPLKKNKLIFQNATPEDFQPEHKESFQIAKSFYELFVKNLTEKEAPLTNLKKSDARAWTNQIVLMLKNSEATTEQLRHVWHFLNKDEFWKTNVQSVPKLREKFSTIYLQSKKIKNEGNSNSGTGGASDDFKRRIFETLTGQVSAEQE